MKSSKPTAVQNFKSIPDLIKKHNTQIREFIGGDQYISCNLDMKDEFEVEIYRFT